jgi:hypothetical protein
MRKKLLLAALLAVGLVGVATRASAEEEAKQRKALAPGLCAICGPFDDEKKCTCVFGEE